MRNRIIQELVRYYPNYHPSVIFDVGANIGQSVEEFNAAFPNAAVYAFEPVPASFDALAARLTSDLKAEAFQIALSSSAGAVDMLASGTSTGNRIAVSAGREGFQQVKTEAGDDFCKKKKIKRIDILKIDTEGHDLNVVAGFSKMLLSGSVGIVQIEVGLVPENDRHVSFNDVMTFMTTLGYRFFRLTGYHALRARPPQFAPSHWADAIFIHPSLGQ